MHQFEKVEQFTVCSPHKDASWQALDDMIASAEAFYQALGLPYQARLAAGLRPCCQASRACMAGAGLRPRR